MKQRRILLNIQVGLLLKSEQVKLLKQNRWNRRGAYLEIGNDIIYFRNLILKQDKIPLIITKRQKLKIKQLRVDHADFNIKVISRIGRRFKAQLVAYPYRSYQKEYKRDNDQSELEEEYCS